MKNKELTSNLEEIAGRVAALTENTPSHGGDVKPNLGIPIYGR